MKEKPRKKEILPGIEAEYITWGYISDKLSFTIEVRNEEWLE
jgi:hypothetical protein